jgi:hypothetical protein
MADDIFAPVLLWQASGGNCVELALSRSFYGCQHGIISELLITVARHQFRQTGSESKQQASKARASNLGEGRRASTSTAILKTSVTPNQPLPQHPQQHSHLLTERRMTVA